MNKFRESKIKIYIYILFVIIISVLLYIIFTSNSIKDNDMKEYEYLKKYDSNQFIPIYVSDEEVANKYFNEFKNNLMFDIEQAWEDLNKSYRTKRFGTFENFNAYVENLKNSSLSFMTPSKYKIIDFQGYKIFKVYDSNSNLYIFKENSIMNYEVFLDEDTISIN